MRGSTAIAAAGPGRTRRPPGPRQPPGRRPSAGERDSPRRRHSPPSAIRTATAGNELRTAVASVDRPAIVLRKDLLDSCSSARHSARHRVPTSPSGPASQRPPPRTGNHRASMTVTTTPTPPTTDDDWWRSAVVYQVYVRSFADANGDGIGDLPGIRQRLPYLRDLGVDALWLTPFYTSPHDRRRLRRGRLPRRRPDVRHPRRLRRDDRRRARPRPADHRRPGAEPHLQRAPAGSPPPSPPAPAPRSGPATSSATAGARTASCPRTTGSRIFGGPAWTRVADGQWYLHLFDPAQPDLNWRHPEVRAEFEDVLRFWLDRGVDGFRDRRGARHDQGGRAAGRRLQLDDHRPAPGRNCSARAGCPTSTRTRCTRSTAPGARSWTATPAAGWRSPRRGPRPRSGWPATSARTSCTRRSASTSSTPPGRPTRSAR